MHITNEIVDINWLEQVIITLSYLIIYASTEDLEDATENPQRPHREKTQKNEKTVSTFKCKGLFFKAV